MIQILTSAPSGLAPTAVQAAVPPTVQEAPVAPDAVLVGAFAPPPSASPSFSQGAPSDCTSRAASLSNAAADASAHVAAGAVGVAAGSAVAAGVYAGLKAGFVQGYLPPAEVLSRARDLARRYPDLVELVERPYKTHGYDGKRHDLCGPAPLFYLRLGPRNDAHRDEKVGVLQMAAPHAREWTQPMIMMEMAEQLLANYDPKSADPAVRANTALLDGLDVYLVPVTNPDGQNYSFYDDDMWRKNRSPQRDGSVGVDVNRNYPYKWDADSDSRSVTFAGPGPASEPETRHVMEIVEEHPNVRFVCDWHSYSEEVRRPWGISEQDRPLYERLQNRMADAIASVRGHHYKVNESLVIHGSSDDYFYQAAGLYSAIVEDGTAFHPEPSEARKVMQEGVAGARELLQVALEFEHTHGLEKAHPPAVKPDDPPPEEGGENEHAHAASAVTRQI